LSEFRCDCCGGQIETENDEEAYCEDCGDGPYCMDCLSNHSCEEQMYED